MIEQIAEEFNYRRGYDQGWLDSQKYFSEKFEKILSKNSNQSHNKGYEKGFRQGANQKDNKPCVCGFWGKNNKLD